MKIRIKNQLPGIVKLGIPDDDIQLSPEEDRIVEVNIGDCIYIDRLIPDNKPIPYELTNKASVDDD